MMIQRGKCMEEEILRIYSQGNCQKVTAGFSLYSQVFQFKIFKFPLLKEKNLLSLKK